jgi:hypothetical protein
MFLHYYLGQCLIDAANAPSPIDPSRRIRYGVDALYLVSVVSVMALGLMFEQAGLAKMSESIPTWTADDRGTVGRCFQNGHLQTW